MIPIQSSELHTKSNAYPWLWMKIQIAVNHQSNHSLKIWTNQRKSQLQFKSQTSACGIKAVRVEFRGCLSPIPFKTFDWVIWSWPKVYDLDLKVYDRDLKVYDLDRKYTIFTESIRSWLKVHDLNRKYTISTWKYTISTWKYTILTQSIRSLPKVYDLYPKYTILTWKYTI